ETMSAGRWGVACQRTARPCRRRWLHVVILALVVGAGAGGYYVLSQRPGASNILAFCGAEVTVVHYHPLLVINDHGVQKPLPWDSSKSADIGAINDPLYTNPKYYCPAGQLHLIHTHDGSGIIQVELPQLMNPTLGSF